ncbi:SGNH/GDSL hydrolase family protein [uncultured Aquimarina sp.]|uniref:SGNH/GDSL hydrolase family protein n=1 Tax=uncultured Aquimarina sp. TaxID=575652 RepID=UPI0026164612|nr:SGNH/GDSL hydrolase family protein [uncultured Aquimarina sp.]
MLCELLVSILVSDGYFLFQPNTVYEFEVDSTSLKGVSGPTQFSINKDGHRGKPYDFNADYHILTIGGSTTECFYLSENETWPFLLEKQLTNSTHKKVWVGNLGKSGLNSRHHIAQMEYLVPTFPKIDLIIILVGANDLLRELKYSPNYNPLTSSEVMKTTFVHYPSDSINGFPYSFKLVQLISGQNQLFFSKRTTHLDINGSNTNVFRNNRSSTKELIEKVPNMEESLDRYENNINKIVELSEKLNIKIVFVNQPTLWKNNMTNSEIQSLWLGANGDYTKKGQSYFSHKVLRNCMDQLNKRLEQSLEKRSVDLIDLDSKLEKSMNYFYDGMHFNERGAKKVSEILEKSVRTSIHLQSE